MTKTPPRSRLAAAPPQHAPRMPPKRGRGPAPPSADPVANAPPIQGTRAPRQRGVGKVPNPRRPKVVRAHGGGKSRDLFDLFPDLPRPPRPKARTHQKSIAEHLRSRR